MFHHLICHMYCGHAFTKLPFKSHTWKIISLPTVTSMVITANGHRAFTCIHHYSKCFMFIRSFNPHNHFFLLKRTQVTMLTTILIPIFRWRLRLKEVRWLARDHTIYRGARGKKGSRNPNPTLLTTTGYCLSW